MKAKYILGYALAAFLLLSLISCSRPPSLSPKDTVRLYLDELVIFKDPIYRAAARDELGGDPEKIKRFAKAGQTIKELLWTDTSSLMSERRKSLLAVVGTIVTYKDYEIITERVEEERAFVTVIFEKTSLFNKDLGKASQQDSKPITYELIKTRRGWRIKDIDGILAKRGL